MLVHCCTARDIIRLLSKCLCALICFSRRSHIYIILYDTVIILQRCCLYPLERALY